MLASRDPIQAVAEEESDPVVLRGQPEGCSGATGERSLALAEEEIKLSYEKHTDVMHVDLCFPLEGDKVDVVDVGEFTGFPGQVVARINREKQVIYGLTIQNFSGFRRRLLWQYKMASMHRALQLIINLLLAGLCIDRNNRAATLHA